jgi:hypothetical protein
MYINNFRILFVLILLVDIGCKENKIQNGNSEDGQLSPTKKEKKNDSGINFHKTHDTISRSTALVSFFDSVESHVVLSHDQIKTHTTIDSTYWTKLLHRAVFYGDTIYFRMGKHPLVVLNYSDSVVCSYKFLLIFDSAGKINYDYAIVDSRCDDDGGEIYTTLSYEIVNDTTILTKKTSYDRRKGKNNRAVSKDKYLYVGKDGKF